MIGRIRKSLEEKEEGFTLIELLVVIIIIGILAAIAIPVFLSQRKKGYDAQAKSDLRNAATAEETYLTDNNHYTATLTNLSDFKQSPNVKTITLKTYTTAGAAAAADDSDAQQYCIQAASDSATTWVYESWNGGLQASSVTACPATVS